MENQQKIEHPIPALMKLVRFPNLLIIIGTQYVMRYLLVEPLLPSSGFSLQMGNLHFALLVLSTVFIAAAGYIINDYFDTRPDWINKPGRVVVGVSLSRRVAMILHTIFNIIGVGLGVYLSFYIKMPVLSLIYIITTGLLWFYSTTYKRQFLVGNITVAFLTALVPLMVILFELPLLNREYGKILLQYSADLNYIFMWVAGFSIFAFITTLIREIIKDTEDFEGDVAYGMRTIPIVLGVRTTKIILAALIIASVVLLLYVLIGFIMFSGKKPDYISMIYFISFLVLPFLILLTLILLARDKKDYHRASILIKIIMLLGVMYAAVVYYIIKIWM